MAEHPLRERLRGQLMLALYRAATGRALDAYQAARRALVDELGIEPGELRELHQRILNQDPALDLSPEANPSEPEPPRLRLTRVLPAAFPREARKTVTASSRESDLLRSGSDGRPGKRCEVTSRMFAEGQDAVDRHGGTIERSQATQLLPSLGCRSCTRMTPSGRPRRRRDRDRLADLKRRSWRTSVRFNWRRGLVSTGEVVTGGELGTQLRATGEPLTMSSRLGQASQPGESLLTKPHRRSCETSSSSARRAPPCDLSS